jgi:hypothetical protein
MKDEQTRGAGLTADSPVDRLRRDLAALGRLDTTHVSVTERLTAELGDDLYAVVLAELNRLDAGGFPLCTRPRRVA